MQKRSFKQKCLAWLLSLAIAVTFIPLTAGFAFAEGEIAITDADVVLPADDYEFDGKEHFPEPTVTVNETVLSCYSVQIRNEDPEIVDPEGQYKLIFPDTIGGSYLKGGEWHVQVVGVTENGYTGTVEKTFTITWQGIEAFTVSEKNGPELSKEIEFGRDNWDLYIQHGKLTVAWAGKNGEMTTTSEAYIPLNTLLFESDISFGPGDVLFFRAQDGLEVSLTYEELTTYVYGKGEDGNPVDITKIFTTDAADTNAKLALVFAMDDKDKNGKGNAPRGMLGNDTSFKHFSSGKVVSVSKITEIKVIHGGQKDINSLDLEGLKAIYALEDFAPDAVEPYFTLSDGEYVLDDEDDYTVKFENNDAVGEAKVIITGRESYKGTIEKTFRIVETEEDIVDEYGNVVDQLAQTTAQVDMLLNPVQATVSDVTTNSGTINLATGADIDGFAIDGAKQTKATYAATGLAVGGSKAYTVYAYKMVGDTEVKGPEVKVAVNTKPAAVAGMPTVKKARKALTVKKWAAAEGAASYEISVDRDPAADVVKATATTVKKTKVKKLKKKKNYYVKVRAISAYGVPGDWSAVKKIKTK